MKILTALLIALIPVFVVLNIMSFLFGVGEYYNEDVNCPTAHSYIGAFVHPGYRLGCELSAKRF